MSEIRFINVAKHYSNFEAINDLNLTINDGEFMVLVGPSGCAKSTTLRMIAGLESITGGDLYIGNARANELSPKDRNISMVFQSYALFPNMTVRENLSFGMKVRKEKTSDIAKEVTRVAKMLNLGVLLDRKPRQLSGGQAQRVALGRAMIRHPQAFLFDEPLSNLDAELRVQMRAEISQMQNQLDVTTVYVTHDQVEAMTMGDRVAVMDNGKIMQVGPPIDLYTKPQNKFVAGFIGSPKMNFIPINDDGFFGQGLPASVPKSAEMEMGIRPEFVEISANGSNENKLLVEAIVTHKEMLGHETLIHLRHADQTAFTMRATAEAALKHNIGNPLSLALPYERMFFFNKSDGALVK